MDGPLLAIVPLFHPKYRGYFRCVSFKEMKEINALEVCKYGTSDCEDNATVGIIRM